MDLKPTTLGNCNQGRNKVENMDFQVVTCILILFYLLCKDKDRQTYVRTHTYTHTHTHTHTHKDAYE